MELDPRDMIDRVAEQELFAELISLASPARMLVINDKLGRGKTTLLQRLQYNCKYEIKPAVPVCLVDLKDLKDSPEASPLAFVDRIIAGLKIDDKFPKFIKLNNARLRKDPIFFDTQGEQGGQSAGILIEEAAQEAIAQKKCVGAFFEDLCVLCASQPVAILLDHWEKCNHNLQEWIRDTFMKEHCFGPNRNLRPTRLAIVVAGNSHDQAKENFGVRLDELAELFNNQQEYNETVRSIRSLSEWDENHVREFLKQHGYDNVSNEDINMFRDCLKRGKTLRQIVEVAKALSET